VTAAVFAAAGGYASAETFVDGFAPAIGVAAGMAALGAIVALGLPGRRPSATVVDDPAAFLEPERVA
jgi:hypothetical protein